jgi:hypothetical protein
MKREHFGNVGTDERMKLTWVEHYNDFQVS